jgi:hypothetical protein
MSANIVPSSDGQRETSSTFRDGVGDTFDAIEQYTQDWTVEQVENLTDEQVSAAVRRHRPELRGTVIA